MIIMMAALAACAAAAAQTTPEEFQARYERLVRNLGYSGVGIETLLDRWEEAFPESRANIPLNRKKERVEDRILPIFHSNYLLI